MSTFPSKGSGSQSIPFILAYTCPLSFSGWVSDFAFVEKTEYILLLSSVLRREAFLRILHNPNMIPILMSHSMESLSWDLWLCLVMLALSQEKMTHQASLPLLPLKCLFLARGLKFSLRCTACLPLSIAAHLPGYRPKALILQVCNDCVVDLTEAVFPVEEDCLALACSTDCCCSSFMFFSWLALNFWSL